jgi:hypothetical protein
VSRSSVGVALGTAIAIALPGTARADAPAAALDELKQGYALKQANDCPRAIPHLQQSLRLSPTPKAMLNLADCELRTGDLTGAREHAAAGRTLAVLQNQPELVTVADAQVAAIEGRLGWLTIRLSPAAPAGTQVTRDRNILPSGAMGIPEAVNPGPHAIVVSAPAHAPRQVTVTLAEGERTEVTVEAGPALVTAEATTRSSAGNGPSIPFYAALGVGVVGLAVGIGTGVAGQSKHAALEGECSGGGACPASAGGDIDDFHTLKTVSTVAYAAGGAGLVAAAVLWFVLPHPGDGAAARLRIGPASAALSGTF